MWKAEGDKTERENRSRIVLCSWKCGMHGDTGHRQKIKP